MSFEGDPIASVTPTNNDRHHGIQKAAKRLLAASYLPTNSLKLRHWRPCISRHMIGLHTSDWDSKQHASTTDNRLLWAAVTEAYGIGSQDQYNIELLCSSK
jgi:hypothetical protein